MRCAPCSLISVVLLPMSVGYLAITNDDLACSSSTSIVSFVYFSLSHGYTFILV